MVSSTPQITTEQREAPQQNPHAEESNEQEEMSSNEERLLILRMVEQGKISAEEAARLLNALGGDDTPGQTGGRTPGQRDPFDTAHGLRIRVQDMRTGHEQVNINVPTGLVRFGLRFVPNSAGIDVQSVEDALNAGSVGKILEVADEDSGKRVQIFVE